MIAESLELTDKFGAIAIDEQAFVMILATSASLGERDQVLRLSARALDRGFTSVVMLSICLETVAAVLTPEAPATAAVLHGYVDTFVPSLVREHRMHVALRQRAIAAIEAQLGAERANELHAEGAALTQEEAASYALAAIARVLRDE